MLIDAILRSLVLVIVGLGVLLWGEARWQEVDRAKAALKTGKFARYIVEGGSLTWR